MTITNGYATLTKLKARLWPVGTTPDSTDDTMLENIVMSVSRWIDFYTGRRFFSTASDETRYYTAVNWGELWPGDDVISVTTLACDEDGDRVYERTWATTDYDLLPANASLDSKPYTHLKVTPTGNYTFSRVSRGVKIVGKFGYCATGNHPLMIEEACLLQCERMYKRKDAAFGVMGNTEMGVVRLRDALDPDVVQMLAPFVSWQV